MATSLPLKINLKSISKLPNFGKMVSKFYQEMFHSGISSDRVKDTDFGDIFNLSPIPVLFAQILYGGESHRYWWQNYFLEFSEL